MFELQVSRRLFWAALCLLLVSTMFGAAANAQEFYSGAGEQGISWFELCRVGNQITGGKVFFDGDPQPVNLSFPPGGCTVGQGFCGSGIPGCVPGQETTIPFLTIAEGPGTSLVAAIETYRRGKGQADCQRTFPLGLTATKRNCQPGPTTLCLNDNRFKVEANWQSATDGGKANVVLQGQDSGEFSFFNPENTELNVKVVDACFAPFNHFWVFAAGLTNVEVTLTVTDTISNERRDYKNPLNRPFQPIQDTQAFATCP